MTTNNFGGGTMIWAGRILSALVVILLLADAAVGAFKPAMLHDEFVATGFAANSAGPIALITALCAIIYAVPSTAVLGAILITGFCGGAICTHFRIGELGSPPQIFCLLLGIAAWGSLYLRDPRVRALLPIAR